MSPTTTSLPQAKRIRSRSLWKPVLLMLVWTINNTSPSITHSCDQARLNFLLDKRPRPGRNSGGSRESSSAASLRRWLKQIYPHGSGASHRASHLKRVVLIETTVNNRRAYG